METGLNLVGLALTAIGAGLAAWNVIITPEQAEALSGTYYNGNNALRDALLAQSRGARTGLWFVVAGTALQAVALIISQGNAQETKSMALGYCMMEDAKTKGAPGFITTCMISKGHVFD